MTMTAIAIPLETIELERVMTLPDGRVVEWEALGGGSEPLVWVEGGPASRRTWLAPTSCRCSTGSAATW